MSRYVPTDEMGKIIAKIEGQHIWERLNRLARMCGGTASVSTMGDRCSMALYGADRNLIVQTLWHADDEAALTELAGRWADFMERRYLLVESRLTPRVDTLAAIGC